MSLQLSQIYLLNTPSFPYNEVPAQYSDQVFCPHDSFWHFIFFYLLPVPAPG